MLSFKAVSTLYKYYAKRAEAASIDPLTMPYVLQGGSVQLTPERQRLALQLPSSQLKRDIVDGYRSVVAEVGDFVMRTSEEIPSIPVTPLDDPLNVRILERIGSILVPSSKHLKAGFIDAITVKALIPEQTNEELKKLAFNSWTKSQRCGAAYESTWNNPDRQVILHLEGTLRAGGKNGGQLACLGMVAARPRLDGYAFCAAPFPTNELLFRSVRRSSAAVTEVMDKYNVLMAVQGGFEMGRD